MSEDLEVKQRPDLLGSRLDCPNWNCRGPLTIIEAYEYDGEVWIAGKCPLCGCEPATYFGLDEEVYIDPCMMRFAFTQL